MLNFVHWLFWSAENTFMQYKIIIVFGINLHVTTFKLFLIVHDQYGYHLGFIIFVWQSHKTKIEFRAYAPDILLCLSHIALTENLYTHLISNIKLNPIDSKTKMRLACIYLTACAQIPAITKILTCFLLNPVWVNWKHLPQEHHLHLPIIFLTLPLILDCIKGSYCSVHFVVVWAMAVQVTLK